MNNIQGIENAPIFRNLNAFGETVKKGLEKAKEVAAINDPDEPDRTERDFMDGDLMPKTEE